jgi:O-antigen/teichoic acid export membrane protein
MSFQTGVYPASQTPNTESKPDEGHSSLTRMAVASPQTSALLKRGRFSINLLANLAQLAVSLGVGVWYVPFLVRELGHTAYGLIPLTAALTSYMGLVTFGLNQPVARFLIIELEREDHHRANLVFNTSFWTNLALAVCLLIPALLGVAYIGHLVRIPPSYETATRWLFAGTAAAFLLNQIKTPFAVSAFSRNRLDLLNLAAVSETLTRVGLILLLFSLATARIEYVGAAILAGTLVSMTMVIYQWRVLTPTLRVAPSLFDWTMFRALGATGGWATISQLGGMLYLNIDLIVANRLFGADLGGKYAAVLQIPYLLTSLSLAVGGIFPPTTYQLYALGDMEALVAFLRRSIRFLGLVMAVPIGLICGFSEPLLRLWLGPSFSGFAPLLVLMTVYMCLTVAMYPLYAVPMAANRVKAQGLVTLAVGVVNLGLALFLAGPLGWGLYGVAAAIGIAMTVRYVLFIPLYAAYILKQPFGTFLRGTLPIVATTAAVIGLADTVSFRWPISNWLELALAGGVVSLVAAAAVYAFLRPEERAALKDIVVRWRK